MFKKNHDEFENDSLELNGERYFQDEDDTFDLLMSRMSGVKLSDIPTGTKVRLCDRIIDSSDLNARYPYCIFEKTESGEILCHIEVAFFPHEDDLSDKECNTYLREALDFARHALEPLRKSGIVVKDDPSVYEKIAYFNATLRMSDQPLLEAEKYVEAIEERMSSDALRPVVFICHASENKPFVERLVTELDRRALYVWFDKREIFVGDSIVQRINEALAKTKLVIPVLSTQSIKKPWVIKELGSSLMRQLQDQGVVVLPVLLETCEIPPLLADIKYADFRSSFTQGLSDLLDGIRKSRESSAA